MREFVEFRVPEEFASLLFAESEGTRLGDSVRKVALATDDSRFDEVGRLQQEFRARGADRFFYGWEFDRRYSAQELAEAECFHLTIPRAFEPAGEECGTEYDESSACPECGIGAVQRSPLSLDLRKVPTSRDITRTIADEWIVSQRLAEHIASRNITGLELRMVRHAASRNAESIDLDATAAGQSLLRAAKAAGAPYGTWEFNVWLNRVENSDALRRAKEASDRVTERSEARHPQLQPWYQVVVLSTMARIVAPTRAGTDPFDNQNGGACYCARGDLIGLNLLSEVSLKRESRGDADVVCSQEFIGVRRGLLRPQRLVLTSPKFYRLLTSFGARGAKFEVVHLV